MLDKLELNTRAQELRELLGEDINSPIDIFALVNRIEELTLVFYPFSENISGMCVRDEEVKLIAINSTMSYGRQRFTLAHELYHLFYDSNGFNVCSSQLNTNKDNEKDADQFASYFLAPYRSLRKMAKSIADDGFLTMADVIKMEQFFGMSHLAMFWRLVSEGYLYADDLSAFNNGVVRVARSLGYDDKLYKPNVADRQKYTCGHYLKQVEELSKRDIVSEGKIDELLLDAFRDDIVYGIDAE